MAGAESTGGGVAGGGSAGGGVAGDGSAGDKAAGDEAAGDKAAGDEAAGGGAAGGDVPGGVTFDDADERLLRRAVELAAEALAAGDEPFGSLLAAPGGEVLQERRSAVAGGDRTRHPELELARWVAANLPPAERPGLAVYTSAEHCPMCAAAHGWAGLGPIVFASSSAQLASWLADWGLPQPPVATIPVARVLPGWDARGPHPVLADEVRELQRRYFAAR